MVPNGALEEFLPSETILIDQVWARDLGFGIVDF
jgi:hypothetical protein